jgi:hypothetical protein
MVNLDFLKRYEEKIAYSKKVFKSFWELEKIDHMPATAWIPGYYSIDHGMLCPPGKYFTDKKINLNVQLKSIESHLHYFDDLYIPHIDTFIGTPVIASVFGGKIKYFEDKDPWVENQIIHDYKDIDRLKKPDPFKGGLTKKILEWIDYWKLATGDRIPMSITDMQGPLSVAIDLMGASNFYLGLYDDPKRVKKLLEIITELFIDFLNIIYPRVAVEDGVNEWTGIFIPSGRGKCRLSEDNLISISSEMYSEFLHPFNEMIFKETGGGILHWCGDGSNNFENVLASEGITGLHNSSLGDMDLIIRQIEGTNRFNADTGKKVVYFSSMVLPNKKRWVNELLKRQRGYRGVLNFIFLSLDGYGVSFDTGEGMGGYKMMEDDPIEVIKEFTLTTDKN